MVDLLFTRARDVGRIDAILLDQELKAACEKVDAISVAQHCDPYAVFVHVTAELTTEERQAIGDVIANHEGAEGTPDSIRDGHF